jgi:hypothetical protein
VTSDWTSRLIETLDGPALAGATHRLLDQQAHAWPLLADGLQGLKQSRTKRIPLGQSLAAVRYIPHRLKSTTAKVDAASVGARPCFLCLANLPQEQRGLGFGDEWVLLANPFPILESHLTIVHREHVPQRLAGRIAALLTLARWLPDSFVIYNGPACGASAPDHLHFQACTRTLFPIAEAIPEEGALVLEGPARALAFHGTEVGPLAETLERAVAVLAARAGRTDEPLVNLAAFCGRGRLTAFVFPRSVHRPAAFHRGELLVSPAAIDLSGVLVTPREEDFDRLTPDVVRGIYDEVVSGRDVLEAVAARVGPSP